MILTKTALGRPDWLVGGVTWHKCIKGMFCGSLFCHPFWGQMEKLFNAPAVGSDRGGGACHGWHPGECTARGDGKENIRERILPLSECSAVCALCACRLVLWKFKFSLIFLSLHCVVVVVGLAACGTCNRYLSFFAHFLKVGHSLG